MKAAGRVVAAEAGSGGGSAAGSSALSVPGVVESGPGVVRTPALTWNAPAPGDEATRYLCAAAHVDGAFTRRALREFVFDEGRAPAPGSGVDEVLVLRHCLAARARRLHRDVALCVVVLVALLVSAWTVAAWLVWAAGLRLLLTAAVADAANAGGVSGARGGGWFGGVGSGWSAPVAAGMGGSVVSAAPVAAGPWRASSAAVLARFGALLWAAGGVFGVVVVSGLAQPFGSPVRVRLRGVPADPALAWLWVPLGAAGVCWLVVLVERLAARHLLVDRLRRDRFGTHRWVSTETVWARRALAELAARAGGDRHVLADPARPFAGSGRQVLRRRWLLETGPIRFDVDDLVERVTERLAAGVPGLDPQGLLESVVWDDFAVETGPVLVTGQTGDGSLRLLPSGRGSAAVRVFRRFRIAGDPAETVVTAYLSGHSSPGLALVELHGLVLEPVAAAYRRVDRLAPLGVSALAAEAWRSLVLVSSLVAAAPRGAAVAAFDPVRRRHRRAVLDRSAANGVAAANGARTSLRELGVARRGAGVGPLVDREGAVFAREDANLCLAVVERRVREELRPLL